MFIIAYRLWEFNDIIDVVLNTTAVTHAPTITLYITHVSVRTIIIMIFINLSHTVYNDDLRKVGRNV